MYLFISNTGEKVAFSEAEAMTVPYARDILTSSIQELEFPFASTAQLELLRDAIKAKGPSGSFDPKKEHLELGSYRLPLPPFIGLLWSNPFMTFLYSLDRHDIADLIRIADSTCMWRLRHNAIRMMFIRMIVNDAKFEEFFPTSPPRLMEIITNVYYSELTSVSHSGYCDPLDSSGLD